MQIIDRLESLRRREHDATVALIETLVECHRTKAHVDAGYRSVFQLLVERLDYSPAAASRRFAAMRCALRAPFVIEMLRAHRTSLTALAKIAPVLDDADDAEALLRSIDGLGPREVDVTVAAMRPVEKPAERMRPIAITSKQERTSPEVGTLWGSSAAEPASAHGSGGGATSASASPPAVASAPAIAPPRPSAHERPTTSPPRIALSFTLSAEAHAAFQSVRAKLGRTRHRPLTLEETVEALVAHFHAREGEKRSRRKSERRSERRTRHVPRATREAIFRRDGHRCTFVAPDGTRCTATHDLQIDHVVAFARGGGSGPENLRTMCGAHNRRLGEVEFEALALPRAGTAPETLAT